MDGTADTVHQLGIKLWQRIVFVSVVRGVYVRVHVCVSGIYCASVFIVQLMFVIVVILLMAMLLVTLAHL